MFHFGDARDCAGGLAQHDFVLQVDASDEVLALDVDGLERHLLSSAAEAFEYEQRYGAAVLQIARFYDRRRYRWQGRVHEILSRIPSAAGGGSRIRCDTTELLVRHHKSEDKPRPYLAGLALQVLERPQAPRWWHYLGRELLYRRSYRSALEVLEVHASMADAWRAERSQSLCFAGECHEALGEAEQAALAYRRAHDADPSRREPLLRLASFACRRGDFGAAETWARSSLALTRSCAYPELAANYTWMPHSLLYWSLFWVGRKEEAQVHWEAYRSLCPADEFIGAHARLFAPSRGGALRSHAKPGTTLQPPT
jgi:tetratricopeptide (TPR) repeat protein